MSSTDGDDRNVIKRTVALYFKLPGITIPQVMRAAKFSITDSKDPTMQMRVRRAIHAATKRMKDKTIAGLVAASIFADELISPLTDDCQPSTVFASSFASSDTGGGEEIISKPSQEETRNNSIRAVKKVNASKKVSAHKANAFKRATKLYHDELQKSGDHLKEKKSAEKIAEAVKLQFDGVGPSARTIRRYVNEYSLVNSSPLVKGNPGLLPKWALDNLGIALESYISINQVNNNSANNWRTNLSSHVNGAANCPDVNNH